MCDYECCEREDFGDFGDDRLLAPYDGMEYEARFCDSDREDYEPEESEFADDWADDRMDGDHESALASCGWGTDEDYGYFGGEDY